MLFSTSSAGQGSIFLGGGIPGFVHLDAGKQVGVADPVVLAVVAMPATMLGVRSNVVCG